VAIAATATLSALPAGAQPSAPPLSEFGPVAAPEPDAKGSARPQSPAEETALRNARLDELFARLARKDDKWESVQNEIWLMWSQSGSPAMDLLLLRAGRAMDSGDGELALRYLDDLVRLAPDFAEGWNKRATVTMPSNPKHAIDIARPAMDLQNSSKSLLSLQFCRKSLIKHIYTRMVDREHESG
jgi:hypothetical protein